MELMKDIPTNSIDLILCDLPYGITANKWDKPIPLNRLWKQYLRIVKHDGIICLFGQESFSSELISSNKKMFRYKIIWEKNSATGFLNCAYKPLSVYEEIMIFSYGTVGSRSKNPIRFYPQGISAVNKTKRNNPNSTWRRNKGYSSAKNKLNTNEPYIQKYSGYPTNIIRFPRDKCNLHPTQKPIALLEWLIKTYTLDGDVVLDNCMGSGGTVIACINANRRYIGFEQDEGFYEKANERIKKIIQKKEIHN